VQVVMRLPARESNDDGDGDDDSGDDGDDKF
jgi:hypothetical protein